MRKYLIVIASTLLLANAVAQTDQELAVAGINQAIIKSHIGFIASDELEGRDTPSRGLKTAAKYIESRFIEYGISKAPGMDSYFQEVPMKLMKPATSGTLQLDSSSFELFTDFILLEGDNTDLQAPFVFANYGMESDLDSLDVSGKIVVALCGDGQATSPQKWFSLSSAKRKNVMEAGGLALVELYASSQIPWELLVRYFSGEQVALDMGTEEKAELTHLWMNRAAQELSAGGANGSLQIEGADVEKFVSQNVVGYLEGQDKKLKKEVVVYSAHYDHVGIGQADAEGDSIYNGSRDNAVGTVTVLSAAKNLAMHPVKRSSLFVLFTGEEKGLLGSRYFVGNAPIPTNEMVYCFNSDNAGYNDTSKATIFGLTRTTAESMIIDACSAFGLEAIEDPAPEQGLFDRSDNVNFAAVGIPAPTFSMGFNAFDDAINKYYHQAGDNPETLDYVYLEKFFKSYVYACRLIANAKKAPFWVKGDKYYEAGKSQYK